MLHRLSRTLREIHRLSREAPATCFQDAAVGAMKGLIRFDLHAQHSIFASKQVAATFPANRK